MAALKVNLDFIAYSTPEQNGHVESFHGRFKREYVWPRLSENFDRVSLILFAYDEGRLFLDYSQAQINLIV